MSEAVIADQSRHEEASSDAPAPKKLTAEEDAVISAAVDFAAPLAKKIRNMVWDEYLGQMTRQQANDLNKRIGREIRRAYLRERMAPALPGTVAPAESEPPKEP